MRACRRFVLALSAAGAAAVAGVGCAPTVSLPPVEAEAGRITGSSYAITFLVEGEPLDVGAAPDRLTSAEAVRLAVIHDPRIQAALARVRAALADARQARLLPNPLLSVALRYPTEGDKPVIEAGLTADLLAVLQLRGRASAADHRLRAAGADALATVLDVLSDAREQYVAAQAADGRLAVLRERGRLVGRLLESARGRLKAGEGTSLDVTTLDAQRAALEAEVEDAELERAQARVTLARLLGGPTTDPARWELDAWEAPAGVAGAERDWVNAALSARPEVQARRWELAALGDERALARWAVFDGADVGVASERDASWTLGPAVTTPLPLFDWGQIRAEKATAQVIEGRHQLTQVARQVVEEVRRAWQALGSSRRSLDKIRSEVIPLEERRLAQAEAAYKAGETSLTAFLLAEQDLLEARAKLVDAQRRLSAARFALERAAGGPGVAASATTPATNPSTTGPARSAEGANKALERR